MADRTAITFWGDYLQATAYEAPAGSRLAADLRAVLTGQRRAAQGVFAGADVRGVCDDLGLESHDLAEMLDITNPLAFAICEGWHRPDLGDLAQIAHRLGVPLGALVHDGDYRLRRRTAMYLAYLRDRPEIPF